MKKHWFLSGLLGEALCLLAILALCVRAARSVGALQQERRTWQANVETARQAESDLSQFQRDEAAFARREQALLAAIPLNEPQPFDLVKQLTRIAEQVGARNLSIAIKPNLPAPPASSGSPAAPAGLAMVPIQMECELEFAPLRQLLTRLRSLPRLTTIEELRITRVETILPRQKVTLVVNAYILTSPLR